MRVVCTFTLLDKGFIQLLIVFLILPCLLNISEANIQLRVIGFYIGYMVLASCIYFYLAIWGFGVTTDLKRFDIFLAYFIILYQTVIYGVVGCLLIILITLSLGFCIGMLCGVVVRPQWFNEFRSAFSRVAGINLDKLSAQELEKLEAHCGKQIDVKLKDWLNEKQEVCPICYEDYKTNEIILVLPECKHIYHKEHLIQWISVGNNLCPLCKSDIRVQIQNLPEEVDPSGKFVDDLIKASQQRQNNANEQNSNQNNTDEVQNNPLPNQPGPQQNNQS